MEIEWDISRRESAEDGEPALASPQDTVEGLAGADTIEDSAVQGPFGVSERGSYMDVVNRIAGKLSDCRSAITDTADHEVHVDETASAGTIEGSEANEAS